MEENKLTIKYCKGKNLFSSDKSGKKYTLGVAIGGKNFFNLLDHKKKLNVYSFYLFSKKYNFV